MCDLNIELLDISIPTLKFLTTCSSIEQEFWLSNSIGMSIKGSNKSNPIDLISNKNLIFTEMVLPNFKYINNQYYFNIISNITPIMKNYDYNIPKEFPIQLENKYIFNIKNTKCTIEPLKNISSEGLYINVYYSKKANILKEDILKYGKSIELQLLGFPSEEVFNSINSKNNNELFEIDRIVQDIYQLDNSGSDNNSLNENNSNDDEEDDFEDENEENQYF
jgi:hypothetical protein